MIDINHPRRIFPRNGRTCAGPSRLAVLAFALLLGAASPSHAQDTIRPGDPSLAGAVPFLGTRTIRSYKLEKGIESPVNRSVVTVAEGIEEGVSVYRVTTIHAAAGRGDSAFTTITVRGSDLSLLRHKVKATRDSAVVVRAGDRLTGWVVLPDQPILLLDLEAPAPVFPVDGPAPWLLTAFPLREGYRAVIDRFSMWDRAAKPQEIAVSGSETVERGGVPVECWKVDNGPFAIPGYRAWNWVDKKTKMIVRSALLGKPGDPEYWGVTE